MASGKEPKTSSGVPLRVIARDLGSPAIAGAHMTAFAGLTPESVAATIRDANVNADRDRDRLAAVREASAVVDQTCLEVRRQMARTPLSASDREKLETSMIALQRVFGTGAIGEVPAAAAELRAVAENIFGGPEDD